MHRLGRLRLTKKTLIDQWLQIRISLASSSQKLIHLDGLHMKYSSG